MLDRAKVVGMKNGLRSDNDLAHVLHIVSQGGADVMRIEGYGLAEGCNADLTLLTGETLAHAVVDVAPRPLVVKGGRVTARNGQPTVDMP
jgi:cytosine deaminase